MEREAGMSSASTAPDFGYDDPCLHGRYGCSNIGDQSLLKVELGTVLARNWLDLAYCIMMI